MAKKPRSRPVTELPKANLSAIEGAATIAQTLAHSLRAGRRAGDGLSIHVHVGDLFLMGFDEAIDAEEWGASGRKEKNARSRRDVEKAEANKKTRRTINFRKGNIVITAAEDAKPSKATPARKRSIAKKTAKRSKR